MTEPHTALTLIQQTVAWAWLSGSIKRAQFDYRVGWSRDMLAALFALLQVLIFPPPPAIKYPENGWPLYFWISSPVGGKYSPQAHHSHLKFGTFIHTYAKQTPGEQNALPIPTGTSTSTFTHKCQARGQQQSVPKLLKFVCSLKSLRQKRGWNCILRPRHKEQGYNLTESTDFMASGAFTGRKWDMHILSCHPHDTIGIKLLVHCLHNKIPDPCSSPLPLNCEMTRVIPVKNESY